MGALVAPEALTEYVCKLWVPWIRPTEPYKGPDRFLTDLTEFVGKHKFILVYIVLEVGDDGDFYI